MILDNSAKRACIYFIYDKDGIIDDYILYQLKDLRESVSFIHCVINGNLTEDGRRLLNETANEVYVRENRETTLALIGQRLPISDGKSLQNMMSYS